jgi:hypothetical protein
MDELSGVGKALKAEKERAMRLENRLAAVDEDNISLKDRMADYEASYGLTDAMREMRVMKAKMKGMDQTGTLVLL